MGFEPKGPIENRQLVDSKSSQNADENLSWGAPRIHGELKKLGFEVTERTVARYLRAVRHRGAPGERWLAFLQNHREVIIALLGPDYGQVADKTVSTAS